MTSQQINKSTSQHDSETDTYAGRFRGELPERSFEFACCIVDLIDELPSNVKGWTLGKQLLRSGTSIGANIAEADQAISDAEFVHRCSIARKEAAETRYWLRLCRAKQLIRSEKSGGLLKKKCYASSVQLFEAHNEPIRSWSCFEYLMLTC